MQRTSARRSSIDNMRQRPRRRWRVQRIVKVVYERSERRDAVGGTVLRHV